MDSKGTNSQFLTAGSDSKEVELTNLGETTVSTKSLSQLERKGLKALLPQITATCISSSYHLTVGIGLAYSAILIPQLEEKNSDIKVSETEASWLASVFCLIGLVGSLMGGYLMDKIGRLGLLKLSVVPGILGWVLIALSSNFTMLIVGRVVAGLASAFFTSPAIVYITEIARKDMRGSFLVMGPTYVSLGMVIGYLKGWLMNWRIVAWISNIYLIIPFFLFFLLPESPPWLVAKGRIREAEKALNWLHKHQDKPFIEMQLKMILKEEEQKKLEENTNGGGKLKEFLKPTGYRPLLIICSVFFFQQFSGIYIFLCYSVTFFEAVGTKMNPYLASIWIGVIRLVMSILNTWMLKYFNRRVLMVTSALGMAFCTFISGLYTLWIKNGTTQLTWVPVIFLLLYVVASMVGFLTIPWTMTAELFPLKIRSLANSISSSAANVIMFFAVQNYFNMVILFGGSAGVQWFFSVVSFASAIFMYVFLPETHKKKLSEIQEYFKNNVMYLRQAKKKTKRSDDVVVDTNSNKREADKLINNV